MLFAVAVDAAFRMFDESLDSVGGGVTRGCADDIGSAVKGLKGLLGLHKCFDLIARAANLHLNIPKTVFVPLHAQNSLAVRNAIKEWLETHIPGWCGVRIQGFGEYLGAMLGPESGGHFWTKSSSKYWEATLLSTAAPMDMALRSSAYNFKCASIPMYLLQLRPPSKELEKFETRALHKLCKVSNGLLHTRAVAHMHLIGLPKVTTFSLCSRAARARVWINQSGLMQNCLTALQTACEAMPVLSVDMHLLAPTWWDNSAMVLESWRAHAYFSSGPSSAAYRNISDR
eukprot:8928827-Karenia_brevis.AAC.1